MTLRVTQDTEPNADAVNWVALAANFDLTGPVIVSRMGKEVLLNMCDRKVSLPVYPSASEGVIVIKRGQSFGRAEPVHGLEEGFEEAITPAGLPEGAIHNEAWVTAAREPITVEEVDMGSSTTCTEKAELLQLLNEYRD